MLLPAGDGNAPFPKHGVVAQGEFGNVVVYVGKLCRAADQLHVLAFGGEGDVSADGVGEQEVILGHVGAELADGMDGQGVHVSAV